MMQNPFLDKPEEPDKIELTCGSCRQPISFFTGKLKPNCPLCGEKLMIDMVQLNDILRREQLKKEQRLAAAGIPTIEHAVPEVPKGEDRRDARSYAIEALKWLAIGTIAIGLMSGLFGLAVYLKG